MTEHEMNREELEHQAMEAIAKQEEEKPEYVERPRSHRVLAWILVGVMVIGVLLYYGWISGILHI
jgi:hypothetical protein